MSPFDTKCASLLKDSPHGHSRSCFRSALNHLELAKYIASHDPGMSMFRAITAEEEAASGLMLCLKELGYADAQKLKHRDHVQKSAITPFLAILGDFFSSTVVNNNITAALHITEVDGQSRLTIAIPTTLNGEPYLAYPVPPLNFSVTSEDKNLSYKKQIEKFTKKAGSSTIVSYIKAQANLRNQLLYAGPDGYPTVKSINPAFISAREARVIVMMRAYLMLKPYKEIQPFVQAALEAFLNMIGSVPSNELHDAV